MHHWFTGHSLLSLTGASVLVFGWGAIPAAVGGSGEAPHVTLTVTDSRGDPLANALVGVHLDPADPPISYSPQLVAKGHTNAAGLFEFDVAKMSAAQREARTSDDHVVDVDVDVIVPDKRLVGFAHQLIPLDQSARHTVVAEFTLPSARISKSSAGFGSSQDSVTVVDETRASQNRALRAGVTPDSTKVATRWVHVMKHNVGEGMTGRFWMQQGRSTHAQITYSFDGGAWRLGEMATEKASRTYKVGMPNHQKFHRIVDAQYTVHRFNSITRYCDRGWCYELRKRTDQLYNWTGGMREESATLTQPSYHRVRVWNGTDEVKSTLHNNTFSTGFTLHGFGVNVRAGYAESTKLHWHINNNCTYNWLGGKTYGPAKAAGTIYASSKSC